VSAEKPVTDDELAAMDKRIAAAAPAPWYGWLETRHSTGGESYIEIAPDADEDNEIYISRFAGTRELKSPNAQLDADIDFIAHAREDMPRLIAEIRRLRGLLPEESQDVDG
jgi:hypothetical protein